MTFTLTPEQDKELQDFFDLHPNVRVTTEKLRCFDRTGSQRVLRFLPDPFKEGDQAYYLFAFDVPDQEIRFAPSESGFTFPE
jgi:hypothetical protein